MLKMKCPNCDKEIVSALLSDVEKIPCGHCKEVVPVENIMVFAEGFTFHRNDLIKRLFRYKTLLDEIANERELLEKSPTASKESKNSLDRLLKALAEVMASGRNNLRIDFKETIRLRYRFNSHDETGMLTNLSMSGVCIDIGGKASSPKKKISVVIEFCLPGVEHAFSLTGRTSWVKKGKSFGVEFNQLEDKDKDILWGFISSAVEG